MATIAVNLLGAFLLGLLLAGLARRGPDTGRRLTLRLLLGTGVLGGFTTYSTFSLDTVALVEGGRWADVLLYTAVTLVLAHRARSVTIAAAGRYSLRRRVRKICPRCASRAMSMRACCSWAACS